jgi:pimeloyl-ACP methyl ester carboxylesterase
MGAYQPLSDLLQQDGNASGPPGISIGLALMLNCRVDYAFTNRRALRATADAYPEMDALGGASNASEQLNAICGAIEASPPRAEVAVPVRSDIPTLILAGKFDGKTPPSQGMSVSENLYRSIFVQLPTLGHTQAMRHPCSIAITQAFYAQPTETPSMDCIDDMQLVFAEPYSTRTVSS